MPYQTPVTSTCTIVYDISEALHKNLSVSDICADIEHRLENGIADRIGNGILTTGIPDVSVESWNTSYEFNEPEGANGVVHAAVTLAVVFEGMDNLHRAQYTPWDKSCAYVSAVFQDMASHGGMSGDLPVEVDEWRISSSVGVIQFVKADYSETDNVALEDIARDQLGIDAIDYQGDDVFYMGRGIASVSRDELITILNDPKSITLFESQVVSDQDYYVVRVDEEINTYEFDTLFLMALEKSVSPEESVDVIMRNWREYVDVFKDGEEYVYKGQGNVPTSTAIIQSIDMIDEPTFNTLREYIQVMSHPDADVQQDSDPLSSNVKSSPSLGQ